MSELDYSYFREMIDFVHQINQKRGIGLIKLNGKEQFSDKDYFGYDDFSAKKIKWEI